jgi:hypothetical protein
MCIGEIVGFAEASSDHPPASSDAENSHITQPARFLHVVRLPYMCRTFPQSRRSEAVGSVGLAQETCPAAPL